MERKKIAIVGHGFVGKATDSIFDNDVDKLIIDPKYGNDIADLKAFNPEFVFICVPTPMGKNGQDGKILEDVINKLHKENIQAILIIKSTVIPSNLNKFEDKFSDIIYNPEFLRERHAIEDFIESEFIILGGESDVARRVASETPGSFLANQFSNPANPLAHKNTTAPEIWKQMNGQVDE